MKKKIIIIAALGLAGIFAWFVTARVRTPRLRHVVLISIDTCRADYFSCYGYPDPTTPNIDALAKQATRFEYVVSPIPMTQPAHCSMLTGRIPPAHGVHNNIGYQLAPSNITLAEILKANGFKTGAIVSSFVLDRQFGLNQGFDSYDDHFTEQNKREHEIERLGDETTRLAFDWLDANRKGKSFLFLHYFDPHFDYVPPEPYATEFAGNPYAGEIAFTDHCIGQLIQKLKDLDLYDSTLLIIAGDHGEMLWEHGEEWHAYFIYESAIRVPLVVRVPGQESGTEIAQPVGLIDIVPTICSLLQIDPPAGIQGMDLSAFLRGDPPANYERYLYSESDSPTRFGAGTLMGISTARWKFIQAPRPELYDVVADPGETNNLVRQEPQRARILEDKLQETLEQSFRTDTDSRKALDAETIKRLESLGYVAGKEEGEIVFDENKPDPKDFVQLIKPLNTVQKLMREKKYAKAREILEEAAPQAPNYIDIYTQLGDIGMEQQDYECAVVNYRRAYHIAPETIPPDLLNNLAWVQATRPALASRDLDEALRYARTICQKTKFKDAHTLDTLAVVYAATGDFTKAIETAQTAWSIAMAANDTEMVQKINLRLKLFRQSKPYIE